MIDRLNTRDIKLRKNWNINLGQNAAYVMLRCWKQDITYSLTVIWLQLVGILLVSVGTQVLISPLILFPLGALFMGHVSWKLWRVLAGTFGRFGMSLFFYRRPCSLNRWRVGFQSDLHLHSYRVKTALVQPLAAASLFLVCIV
jgi:hypothetical protein